MPENSRPEMEHFVAPFDDDSLAETTTAVVEDRKSNLWLDAWRDMRSRIMFWLSAVIIFFVALVSLWPTLFTQVDPRACELSFSKAPPAPGHPLGFDAQGCDVYSRIIHGASTSVSVGLVVILITFVIGTIMGAFAGYFGGIVDTILSRIGDIFFSIPYILAAVVVMTVFSDNRNILVVSVAIGGFAWPVSARILRSEVLRVKNADFVMASESLGLSRFKTLTNHVFPNSIAPLLVVTTISLSAAIVAEAVLSFLGVGLSPADYISWGNDISAAQRDLRNAPTLLLYPSLALTITVLGFVMLGEVVRDALDPKARAQR